MSIVFEANGQAFAATLQDTPAAKAFADQLPLTLELTDFGNGVEKIADLPEKLPTDDAPATASAERGTISYYAPWGNLAIFRKAHGAAHGLVTLGHFDGDFGVIDGAGPVKVTIRKAD